MASLKPAFDPAGTVTAAHASKINDGAAALVLAGARAVERCGLESLARLPSYAVVTAACTKLAGISSDRVNVRGCAIALGHPIGACGARVLVTLFYAMAERKAKRGLATLCLGGGEAVAMLVERP